MGDVIDLSNPVWLNPDFPAFYRNEVALQALESAMKQAARKIPEDRLFTNEL